MNDKRIQAAFGEPPASFEEAMMKAIVRHKRNGKRRFGARELLIAAAIIALLCGAAYAAVRGFGLLDLLTQRQPVLPEATALVQEGIEQTGGDLPDVKFKLEQAISDGEQLFFTLRAMNKRPDEVLLVDSNSMEYSTHESIDHWRTDIPWEEKREVTFDQLAEQQGKQLICAYMNSIGVGEEDSLSYHQPSLAYDGDDIVYVISVPYAAKQGEMIDLDLRLAQFDPWSGYDETIQKATLTASVLPTSDITNYNWDSPVDMPGPGLTITQLYVSATPAGMHTYIHYRPIDGADEFTVMELADTWGGFTRFAFIDDAGNEIETLSTATGGGIEPLSDGSYLFDAMLPAEQPFTGLTVKGRDDVVRFDVHDARPDPDGSAMPQGEPGGGWLDDYDMITVRGAYTHPSATVVLGDGARIPLLQNFDTEYSGITEEMERLAADVNLSVASDGFTLTIDQIAATDGYIWLSYTLKGDEPLVIDRKNDPSIQGEYAVSLAAPMFQGALNGDFDPYNNLGDFRCSQAFHPDPYTLTGWTRLQSSGTPYIFPEQFRLSLWTTGFAHTMWEPSDYQYSIDDSPFGYEITIDRSRATQNVRSVKPNIHFSMGKRHIDVVNVSVSPLGSIIVLDESMMGGERPSNNFLLTDDQGNMLTVETNQSQSAPGGRKQRTTVRHAIEFTGGWASQSIRLVPWMGNLDQQPEDALMPIDQTLPFTVAKSNNAYTLTIDQVQLDTNGMTILYRTNDPYPSMSLQSGERPEDYVKINSLSLRGSMDRATGQRIKRYIWQAERGAAPGEKLKPETLEQIRYISISLWDINPQWDQAVEIPLT